MGTFTLIPPMSLGNLNKAEKLSLLKRYMKLMPSGSDSESPDEISLLADSGVPVLNISAGQVTRMNGIIDELTELTMQASSSEETPEMQQVEADRDTAGNYIVRRVLDYAKLPLAADAFTEDGFLRTGDLGLFDDDGNLYIKGRSKSMILSANGQNIYPEEVEAVVNSQPYVQESVVVDRASKLVALVYLDQEALRKDGLDQEEVSDLPERIRINSADSFRTTARSPR